MELQVVTSLDLPNTWWGLWRNEIGILYEQEGRRGYYYGVVGAPAFGARGIANIAYPVSVGTGIDYIYTHEVGHTMNLWHAPCNGAASPPGYPYPYRDGSIGVWGYDITTSRLVNPGIYRDVMGYCFENIWISDFHFSRATDHRLDGLGAGGEARFSLSFTPAPLAYGGGSFVFFVPYESEWADNLDRIVLTGPEGEYAVTRGSEPRMAVVTGRSSGRIRAIIRDWDGEPLPGEATANVTITRGIPAGGLR